MLTREDDVEIHALHKQGWTISAIARHLGKNQGGSSSDPGFLLALREEVGPEHLGILLDLGNFEPLVTVAHSRFSGANLRDIGLDLEPVYANIARLAPAATLVHAKAYDPASDGSPLLDLDRALGIVAAAGYRGFHDH